MNNAGLIQGREVLRAAYARGYVSRKVDLEKQPIKHSKICGDYIEAPCFHSTYYHHRIYLK